MAQSSETIDDQLDLLFGPDLSGERAERAECLQLVAKALAPLPVSNLWLFDGKGTVVAAWPAATSPHDPPIIRDLPSFRNRAVKSGHHLDGASVWFWVRDFIEEIESVCLVGRCECANDGIAAIVDRITDAVPLIGMAAWLAFREVIRGDAVSFLNVKLEQLTRQHSAFRQEYQRIVAEILEERDARLREQQNYVVRLEEEVAARTAELVTQKQRLEAVNLRMKRDLDAAARIQSALLPTRSPQVDHFEFAWRYQPCDELGGDSLNIIPLDQGRLAVHVLDVSGHGVQAALLSVTLSRVLSPPTDASTILVHHADEGAIRVRPPVEVAALLNRRFPMDEATGQYFTLLYGIVETNPPRFRWTSAGHPGLIYVPASGSPRIEAMRSFPIGWADECLCTERSIELAPGDRIFLYSDGIPDAANALGERFGFDRILEAVASTRSLPLSNALDRLLEQVAAWCGESRHGDDLSIVAFGMT